MSYDDLESQVNALLKFSKAAETNRIIRFLL